MAAGRPDEAIIIRYVITCRSTSSARHSYRPARELQPRLPERALTGRRPGRLGAGHGVGHYAKIGHPDIH